MERGEIALPKFILKPGVNLAGIKPEMAFAAIACYGAYAEIGLDVVVTSGLDGKHSANSKHYSGHGLDIRTRHVPAEKLDALTASIRGCLGDDYDVVLESDHVHIEFDPK